MFWYINVFLLDSVVERMGFIIMYKNFKLYKSNKIFYINVLKIRLILCIFLRLKKFRDFWK